MEYSEQFYSTVLQNMINGFAYHKIITDENNLPIDYEFLDVNKEFEGLTGLKRENVIGRRVTEVLPGIEHSDFNWIEFYGNVALNGTKEKFVQYSAELKKWYMVYVYSNTENYFITIFNDISELKNNEQVLIQQNDEISALYEEIVATEEELRQQVDELTLYSDLLKTSEYRLNSAQQIAHVGNWELNLQNKTIWASEEALRIYGLDISYLNAPFIVFQNLVNANDRPRLDLALDLLIKKNEKYDLEFRIKPANCPKEKIIHSIAQIHYDVFGRPEKVFGVIQDITERKIIELKLKQNNEELKKQFDEIQLHKEYLRLSEERYKALADNSEDIIFSCNVDGVLTAVNKKFCEVSGLSMDKVIGSDLSVLFKSKKEITLLNKILKNIKETGEKRITEIEYTSIEGNFHIYSVVLTPLFDINKQIIGITGTNHDITQLRKDEQTVGHLAYYDSLTDLPNRLLFIDRLKAAMNQAKERYQKVGVIFLDFDNFKKINDTLGHFIGDEVIKEVSKALKRVLKKRETLSRFSGDEFAIFIENITKKEDILSFIYRLLNVFKDSFMVDGNALYMSSSIGISIFPDDGDNVDELLRNADTAMYKAKENGKGLSSFLMPI